ncbi:MAG: glycosyltransferase [Chloroflexota bacterium]
MLELLPGILTYLVISSLVWASFTKPALFAAGILLYDGLWLYRSCSFAMRAVVAYRELRRWQAADWLGAASRLPRWQRVHHLVLIPTYGESVELLRSTLHHLAQQDFPRERLAVVLGFEQRDRQAWERAEVLLAEFGSSFGYLWASFHPIMPGEVAGKSSNEAWAARYAKRRLIDEAGVDIACTTVTTCDADSRLSPKYFSALTYHFLTQSRYFIYQPALLFYANIWRVAVPSRVMNSLHSVWQLAKLTRTDKLMPQSTYSMSLELCAEAGYWDVDVIPEDSHMFFKLLFRFGAQVRVVPLYLPVMADAVEGTSFMATIRCQFNQEKRWAWGVSDLPYVLKGWGGTADAGSVSLGYRVLRYVEDHLNWPVGPFLLTFGGSAPIFFNHQFGMSRFGQAFPALTSYIMTASLIFSVALWGIDWKLKPAASDARPVLRKIVGLAEWLLLPVTGLLLSALPGLVAHTRLLLGRYMEYNVTQKLAPAALDGAEPGLAVTAGEPVGV